MNERDRVQRFDEVTKKGIEVASIGHELLVMLKYFCPNTNPNMPNNNIDK